MAEQNKLFAKSIEDSKKKKNNEPSADSNKQQEKATVADEGVTPRSEQVGARIKATKKARQRKAEEMAAEQRRQADQTTADEAAMEREREAAIKSWMRRVAPSEIGADATPEEIEKHVNKEFQKGIDIVKGGGKTAQGTDIALAAGGFAEGLRKWRQGRDATLEKRKSDRQKAEAFAIDTTAEREALRKESGLAQRLEETQQEREDIRQSYEQDIAGQGPSLARAQLRSAQERTLADQLAQAQSRRPVSAAGLQQALQRQQQQDTEDLTARAIQAGVAERGSLEQALAAVTSEDQRLINQTEQSYLQQGFTAEQARQAAAADLEQMNTQRYLANQGAAMQAQMLAMQASQARAARQQQMFGSAFSALGTIGGSLFQTSDKNAKKKIKKADSEDVSKALKVKKSKKNDDIKKDFLDKLKAYTYEYTDDMKDNPKAGRGKQFSVMAQDLEKAGSVGKSMVQSDPETGYKMVDYAKGFGAILAAQAHLNERLNELEKKKSSKSKGTKNGRKK